MARIIRLEKFGGWVAVINPRLIGKYFASAIRDARVDTGELRWRSGWQRLYSTAVANWSAAWGLAFVRGINASGTVTDEYLSFEEISGVTRVFARDKDTGAPTALTTSALAQLSLDNSEWGVFTWRDRAYGFNENDSTNPLFQYTIGDPDSLVVIVRPDPPGSSDALTFSLTYPNSYLDVTAAVAGDITGTGLFNTSSNPIESQFNILTNAGTGAVTFTFDIKNNLGVQDHGYADVFTYTVAYGVDPNTHAYRVDWANFTFVFINDDGSPVEFEMEVIDSYTTSIGSVISGKTWLFRYPPGSDRTLRDNIAKIRVEYSVTTSDTTFNNRSLTFSFLTHGGVDINNAVGIVDYLDISYAYKNASDGIVSTLGPSTRIAFSLLKGFAIQNFTNRWWGYQASLTAQASAETGVNLWVPYAAYVSTGASSGTFRGPFGEFSTVSGLTSTWGVSYDEWALADSFEEGLEVNISFDGITCAAVYKNWTIMGFRGGGQPPTSDRPDGAGNLRHSWQNRPLVFAYAGQDSLNKTRGIDQTLGTYGSDDPEQIIVAGEHIFVLGNRACYGIVGADRPEELGNPIALPNSQGIAGKRAACAFMLDNGTTGCVYLGKNFDTLWFAWIDATFREPNGNHKIWELSEAIRGGIKEFLFDGGTPSNANEIDLYVDERDNVLILQYQNRKVLWRKDVDGKRQWEAYEYEMDGSVWYRSVSQMDHGIRHLASDGMFDESEHDVAGGFIKIESDTPDNGQEMPATGRFWTSADVGGDAYRPYEVWLEKENLDDEYEVELVRNDGTIAETVQVNAGTQYARFSPGIHEMSRRYRVRPKGKSRGKIFQGHIEERKGVRQRV